METVRSWGYEGCYTAVIYEQLIVKAMNERMYQANLVYSLS
jgi:hypothetical protein